MQGTDSFSNPKNISKARQALVTDGYLLIENGYEPARCQEIIRVIDQHVPDDRTEIRYSTTEMRIWDAQKRHELFADFYRESNRFTAGLTGKDLEASTLLAIRNRALDTADHANTLGRWHIDSFRTQLKIFCFLTDTSEGSGPFEFLPRTHTDWFKARMILFGMYFKPLDFTTKEMTRAYQRLDDGRIEKLTSGGHPSVPVICKAGTILVINTSAIHRARPCRQGSRYALTTYCRV